MCEIHTRSHSNAMTWFSYVQRNKALHVKAVGALQRWGDGGELDTAGDGSGRWETLVKERWNNERENRVKGGERMNQGDKSSLWVISQGTRCHWWGWKNTQQSSAMTSPNNCSEPFMVLPETSALENAGKTKEGWCSWRIRPYNMRKYERKLGLQWFCIFLIKPNVAI